MTHGKVTQYTLAVIMMVISSYAASKDISYSFVQGTYGSVTDSSIQGIDVDADSLAATGSFGVAKNIALTVGLRSTDYETFQGIDVDTTELVFGVTAHTPVAEGTSIFGNFSVLKADIEATDGLTTIDDDDTGNVISGGLRHLATDMIELEVGFSRVDVFDDSSTSLGLGIRFYAAEKFSLGIGYGTGDDVDVVSLNARIDL